MKIYKIRSMQSAVVIVMIYFGMISCDSGNDNIAPPVIEPCQDICDTLDFESRDSSVVLSINAIGTEYVMFDVKKYAVNIEKYVAVYRIRDNQLLAALPAVSSDCKNDKMLYTDMWGIKEYDVTDGITTQIKANPPGNIYGATYTSDSDKLLVRLPNASYIYDRRSGKMNLLCSHDNIREYRNATYVFVQDDEFYLYDHNSGASIRYSLEGMPVFSGGIRYPDWDVDTAQGTVAVHIKTVSGNPNDNRLYVFNMNAPNARQVLGHTDNAYTPQYSCDSGLFVVRTCQTSRESYFIKVDPENGCERVFVRAWLSGDGAVVFTRVNK